MTDIVKKAKELIKNGNDEQAKELLLVEGYIKKIDSVVQSEYIKLIPVSDELNYFLNGPYKHLTAKLEKTRLEAITALLKEFIKAAPYKGVRWMRDPRASTPLLTTMEDTNAKIEEKAVTAVARLCERYFPDQRFFQPLVGKLNSKKQQIRMWAAIGIGYLRNQSYLEHLIPLLSDSADKVRVEVYRVLLIISKESYDALHQIPMSISKKNMKMLESRMIEALDDPHCDVRTLATNFISHHNLPGAIDVLKRASAKEKIPATKESMETAINNLSAL